MFCTQFMMMYSDSSIHSKVMRGSQNFEIWSRDPGHAHLGVVLWLRRSRARSKFEADLYLFKSYKGVPKISKFGHVTQATPTYGSFYGPHTVGVSPLCLCQFSSR